MRFVIKLWWVTIIVLILLLPFNFNARPISNGVKIGQVISIERSGIFNKTNEITVARGGVTNGTGSVANVTHVTSSNVYLTELNYALSEQKEIEIFYHCPIVYYSFSSNSACFIDNVNVRK